jgi:cell division protein ZapA
MAQVSVTIDGKAYRMACEEGQEDHLTNLASRFDQYVSHLKGQFGEIGDLRLTVMAAIMVTDELSEVDRRLKALEAEVDGLKRARDAAVADQSDAEEALASALGEVTSQIQGLASRIANRPPVAGQAGHHGAGQSGTGSLVPGQSRPGQPQSGHSPMGQAQPGQAPSGEHVKSAR